MKISYKKIEKSDSNHLADWLASETWPFFLGARPTKEEVLLRIKGGDFFGEGELNFWIQDDVKSPIGLIEIYELNDLAPMFSVRLRTNARGQGLGKSIVDWITGYIFEHYPDVHRIEAQTREDNIPMRKVFSRTGYVKEAYYRMASPTEDGGRVASIAYGILREDWLSGTLTPVQWNADSFFEDRQM